jgi:cytochrome c peroxidase
MARHQLGVEIAADDLAAILAFLNALTASPDAGLAAMPELPESGPDTPAADPS